MKKRIFFYTTLFAFLMVMIPWIGKADTAVTLNFTKAGGTQAVVVPSAQVFGNGQSNSWVTISSALWFKNTLNFTVTAAPNTGFPRMDCFRVANSVTVVVYQEGNSLVGITKPIQSSDMIIQPAKWYSPVPSSLS